MKRALIILGILIVIVLIVIGVLLFLKSNSKGTQQIQTPSTSFPVSGSSQSSGGSVSTNGTSKSGFTVASVQGANIATQDFIHNGTTVEDSENPGNYYLAGSLGYCLPNGSCPSGAPSTDYHIVYSSQDQSFTIALINEPIGGVRLEAEQFLMKTLGITEQQMCNLKYQVLTTESVNAEYAGENLGFSFCPGAVALPS